MVRKVSHGWNFRHQSESNSGGNIRLSDITKRYNSRFVFNKEKKVFLTTAQVKFLVESLEHLEDLVDGIVPPKNKAGKKFLEVAKGKVRPTTICEEAFLYVKKRKISLQNLKEELEKRIK